MVCFAFWFGEVRSIVVAYNLGMLMISGQYITIRLYLYQVANSGPYLDEKYCERPCQIWNYFIELSDR